MDSVAAFLAMGGYGGFVWISFGVTVVVLSGLLLVSLRSLKARRAALAALQTQTGGSRDSAGEA